MATILYRKLDANHDPIYGQGRANYLTDVDAVAQAIQTRLLLFVGEWWENTLDGLPLWQQILGASASPANQQKITLLIQQRILGTPYVLPNGIQSLYASFNRATLTFDFYAVVQTQFGAVVVTNMPQPPSAGSF